MIQLHHKHATRYHNRDKQKRTSIGQDNNFFSVSSRAVTYSVEASFNEYICI